MKKMTVDEFCKQPQGSFKKLIQKKEAFLEDLENRRTERVRASSKDSKELALAA